MFSVYADPCQYQAWRLGPDSSMERGGKQNLMKEIKRKIQQKNIKKHFLYARYIYKERQMSSLALLNEISNLIYV